MRVSVCNHTNPVGARFCGECGAALAPGCRQCAAPLVAGTKFCHACGAAVVAAATFVGMAGAAPISYTPQHLAAKILKTRSALEGERKEVTVLFADVKGSLELAGRLGPEAWHEILDRFFAILTDGVHRFEGTINQYTGDGIMALFGAPIAHEDHAQRACYAALHLRERLQDYADRLRLERSIDFGVRMGINSGDVVVGRIGDDLRMDYTAQGHTVGLAQRIEQLAAPGEVLVSEHTRRLVEGYFVMHARGASAVAGVDAPVAIHVLAETGGPRTRIEVARVRGLSGFVGRDGEMQTLATALERAREGHGQVAGVVGEPGLGKSRLCYEFAERCRAAGIPVFEARCLAHGRNIPFLPIFELFRSYFGIEAADTPERARGRIGEALAFLDAAWHESLPILYEFLGIADPEAPGLRIDADARQQRLFALLRQVYRGQAERGAATVVLIDDVHWIDPASDAFVAQMAAATTESSRNLLLLNFRPEYRADWLHRVDYHQVTLMPLGTQATNALIGSLLGADPSLGDLAARIVRWTAGNPFYIEEVVRELAEAGHLAGVPGAYRLASGIETLLMPVSVRAVLAARIDRLGEREKHVLQVAAVIGKEFGETVLSRALASLDGSTATAEALAAVLQTLMDGKFVHERATQPETEYAFRHPLTQEVALASQLRERRERAHAAVARVIEDALGDRVDENAALLAHHHEQAGDARAAARWHRRAAEWAGLKDINAALHHWQKVRELARQDGTEAESVAYTVMSCTHALAYAWRLGASASHWADVFAEGCAAAESAGDFAALARLNASYSIERALNQCIAPDYVSYSAKAVLLADRSGDRSLRCGTRACLALGHGYLGQLRDSERVADELITLAAGDPHLGVDATGFSALITGRFVRQRAIGFIRDPATALREIPQIRQAAFDAGYPEQALWTLYAEAELKFHARRPDGAGALAENALSLAARLGVGNELMAALAVCAVLECERDWLALRDAAMKALAALRERGALRLVEAIFLAHLGVAELELGNVSESRIAAAAGVEFMRTSSSLINPHSYAVLARAQLALGETTAAITQILDEYAIVLIRTECNLLRTDLLDLRAQLALREGDVEASAALLRDAAESRAQFGVTSTAAVVESLI